MDRWYSGLWNYLLSTKKSIGSPGLTEEPRITKAILLQSENTQDSLSYPCKFPKLRWDNLHSVSKIYLSRKRSLSKSKEKERLYSALRRKIEI